MTRSTLALRLAGPMQAWGAPSDFNVRQTADRPTKSGVIGLLAAAQGRRRGADIADLIGLEFGVRVDQPGEILRDFHTVATLSGDNLLSAKVNKKGLQTKSSTPNQVTTRYYRQDAVYVACVSGETELLEALAHAVLNPRFPLSLGRRSCPPSRPLLICTDTGSRLHEGGVADVLRSLPWQASKWYRKDRRIGASVDLAATVDAIDGDDIASDVPTTFESKRRAFTSRTVRHLWITVPTGKEPDDSHPVHDPFALLGW